MLTKEDKKLLKESKVLEEQIIKEAMDNIPEKQLTDLKEKIKESFEQCGLKYSSETLYAGTKALGILQAVAYGAKGIDSMASTIFMAFFALLGYQLKKEKNDRTKNRK